jgi:hypothetical protein
MINTLRITGVIAVILAGVLFVFPVVFGVRNDALINEFLGSPGAREKFEKATSSKAQNNEERASPLVQQAEAFALYLNPPKSSVAAASRDQKATGLVRPLQSVSPKFKVFATTYFHNNPEMSRALIDEPGRGRHWVRQSSTVGHLVIDQVKDGIVVVKSNEETFEVPLEEIPAAAAATPTSPVSTVPAPRDVASRSRTALSASAKTPSGTTPVARALPQQPASTEKDAKLQELARQLIDVQRNPTASSGTAGLSDAEKTARTLDLITKYRAAQRSVRVSPNEAKELGALGKELEPTQGEPNTPVPAIDEGKIEAGPPADPNGSADSGSEP